jgi:hypothetical protein
MMSLQNDLDENRAPVTSESTLLEIADQQEIKEQDAEEKKLPMTSEAVKVELSCSESCDDGNPCTFEYCNETTDFKCANTVLRDEVEGCKGLVQGTCYKNSCVSGACTLIYSSVCCGNDKCDADEDYTLCPRDCPQEVQQTNISQQTTTTQQSSNQEQVSLDHVIINEFATSGPVGAYDEFAELYNPTRNDIDITGWKFQYKSATGDMWQSKVGSGLSGAVKSKSFFLLASKGYSLSTSPDYTHTANWGLADIGGHLRIIDANSTIIDKVGWGDANEPEGSATVALEENKSLERKSLTTDTDNNANDFILSTPTPKNSTN